MNPDPQELVIVGHGAAGLEGRGGRLGGFGFNRDQARARRQAPHHRADAARRRGDQEEHEDRTHAIVGEPFPHLGEEQRGQPARVPEKRGGQLKPRLRAELAPPPLFRAPLFFL